MQDEIEVSAGVDRRKSAMLFNQSLLYYDVRSFNRLKEAPMKKMAKPALWRLSSATFSTAPQTLAPGRFNPLLDPRARAHYVPCLFEASGKVVLPVPIS